MAESALSDLKVLECGQLIAGPYCAKLLGDLGADVIKVETPGSGDEARRHEPYLGDVAHSERSGLFLYLNTNKRGITLNLECERGREIFYELIKDIDIFVENLSPQVMQQLGLHYEKLREINPRLVMTSVTPFGQTGPYRDYKAHDLNLWHAGGMGYLTREERLGEGWGPPVKAGGRQADFTAGLTAAVATMTAICARQLTGLGQWVDVSEMECVASLPQGPIAFPALEGRIVGNFYQPTFPGGIVECKDGWVLIRPIQESDWRNLATAMGSPAWAKEELWADRQARIDNFEFLTARVKEWASQLTQKEILESTQANHVPTAALNTAADVVNGQQFRARGFFVELEHPETGPIKYPSASYKFSETPWYAQRPAPLLGQHNEEIYGQRLGCGVEELVTLKERGTI